MLKNKRIQFLKTEKKNPRIFILDGIVILLSIFLLILSVSAVQEVWDSYHGMVYSEDSFSYRLEEESYADMVSMYHKNAAAGKENKKSLQEYYGVAKYFEAASSYKLYLEAGDAKKAEAWKKKMDEAYVQMGDFSFVSEKILSKLGL